MFSTIEEALKDVKKGKIIIIMDDEKRENEGDFYVPAKHATPENINFMIKEGRGLLCMPIEEKLAKKLQLSDMVFNNTDSHNTAFTVSIDYIDTHTGISAYERALTIQKVIEKDVSPDSFKRPGHIFPLKAKKYGILERPGHTEAAVDISKLAGLHPSGVICEIIKDNGQMARRDDLIKISKKFNLKIITIEALIKYLKRNVSYLSKSNAANLPTDFGNFKVVSYRDEITGLEHLVLIKGTLKENDNVIARIHSECLTGDVFGSRKCDCGNQLRESMKIIEDNGSGIIIYLRQEGRGIGIFNKINAYNLQDKGKDTVEANLELGFNQDLREYSVAAQILKDLGVYKISLLTNNPLKINGLAEYGVEVVERIPIETEINKDNKNYIKTKIKKMSHMIGIQNN